MKFILKAIGTVIGAVVLLFGFLYFYTGGMTHVAEDFFESVSKNELDDANKLLSSYTVNDAESIYSFLVDNNMNQVKSSSWHARNFVNNKGSIAGEVTNTNGESIPTRVDFVKQDGDWKIYAIAKQSPKALLIPNEPTISHIENLVSQSMAVFMDAAKQKSMELFYGYTAGFWQSQTTVADLDKAFGSIYNYQGDYNFLNNIKPTIESAVIDENNLLIIKGYFPLNASRIVISQKYIYEAAAWKLMSFSYSNEKN
jgi:hypothetical protein